MRQVNLQSRKHISRIHMHARVQEFANALCPLQWGIHVREQRLLDFEIVVESGNEGGEKKERTCLHTRYVKMEHSVYRVEQIHIVSRALFDYFVNYIAHSKVNFDSSE